jgi:hypothetical protein
MYRKYAMSTIQHLTRIAYLGLIPVRFFHTLRGLTHGHLAGFLRDLFVFAGLNGKHYDLASHLCSFSPMGKRQAFWSMLRVLASQF